MSHSRTRLTEARAGETRPAHVVMAAITRNRKIVWGTLAAAAVVAAAAWAIRLSFGQADVSGEDPAERIAAIHEMTAKRPSGAGKALARAAADDPSPLVRGDAMGGLSHFLAPEHRAVVEKGTKDSDGRVRAIAADTLGLFGDKAAADVLVKVIETDQDEQVVQAALRGIVRCDDPRAIVMLLETAANGSSSAVKMVAMKGLLRKFGAKIPENRDPDKNASWLDLIQRWKRSIRVRDAYAAAGARLVDRPQDVIGKPCHPMPIDPSKHKH